jgi:hypothetical protein
MNSRDVVESKTERLRRTKPALGSMVLVMAEEAADLIGVRPTLLSTWRQADQGPAYFKIGRAVLYDLDAVLEFIDNRRSWLEQIA